MDVYVKIKDEKHAEKVIKRLVRIGYVEWLMMGTISLSGVSVIGVFSNGEYQLLGSNPGYNLIKPKDVMTSKPVKYFMEHKHV